MSTFIPLVTKISLSTFMPHELGVSIGGVPFKLLVGPN